ncbi:hypothetical protein Tco_0089893 [Tanacetum coccineum]
MSTLTLDGLVVASENGPPMLKNGSYDTWKSRLLMYVEGKDSSNETRKLEGHQKRDYRLWLILNVDEWKQIECVIMAANIVLQGLLNDINTLLNHRKIANSIWNMNQDVANAIRAERAARTHDPLAITQANIHNGRVTIQSVPTRLTESCASNNGKAKATRTYVIKNVGDYSGANVIDQSSSKDEANEIRAEIAARTHDPLALVSKTYNASTLYTNPTPQYNQQMSYAPQQSHDAPISLNKNVLFLSKAFTTRYPPTNNQLRISSNPKTQANIQSGKVTVQSEPARQTQSCASNNRKAKATETDVIKNVVDYAGANIIDQSS